MQMAANARGVKALNEDKSRLELLLFNLNGNQLFGINVFKVSEAMPCPHLSQLPSSSPYLIGVASVRGKNIPVIELSRAMACRKPTSLKNASVIVCESGDKLYGFLVQNIRQIVSLSWSDVNPPPKMVEKSSCISAITQLDDGKTVQVVDFERVLNIVDPRSFSDYGECEWVRRNELEGMQLLVVDDSKFAQKQLARFLDYIGAVYVFADNGKEALNILRDWHQEGEGALDSLAMVITDVEMPILDGFTLVKELRADHRLSHLSLCLYSSLGKSLSRYIGTDISVDAVVAKGNEQGLLQALRQCRPKVSDEKACA